MPSYKILEVSGPNLWNGPNGPVNFFDLRLDGVEKVVGLGQKPDRPAPQAGEQINLTLEPDPRKPGKLKGKREQQGFGGGPRPEDPKKSAAILRQHSQHMALLYVQNQPEQSRPKSWGEFWQIVDKFDEDVQKVRAAA